MKTIRNLFFVAFAAMTVAGCQEELANPNDEMQGTGEVVTFTGSVDYAETKTAIHYEEGVTEFATLFTTADLISVNGVKSETVTPSSDQQSISFSVAGVTGPYYAVTGTHDRGFDASTNSYSVLMPGTGAPQKYRTTGEEGQYASFWTSADILAACSESEELKFKHMSVFYAITINPETSSVKDNIKTIYVRQGDGSDIAGTWTLSFGENGLPSLEPKSLSALIAYDCGEKGLSQGATMIVGLPAYNYAEGLIFTIKDVNGKFASFKVPAEKTQHAADGGLIIPFKPSFNPQSRSIKSVEDWEAFAACMNAGSNDWDVYTWIGDGTIKLEADISADDLTPITKEFKYVFDGNDKTITRNAASKPLFSKVSGEIKKLKLGGTLDLGSASGAPLVNELAEGGKVFGCTNNMSVKTVRTGHTYVSGLVAFMRSATIENCTNNGDVDVTVNVNATEYNVAVGGIVSDIRIADADEVRKASLENCTNTGALTLCPELSFESASTTRNKGMVVGGLGGIVGWLRNSATYTFTNCDNSGAITLDASKITHSKGNSPYPAAVGGVLGLAAPFDGEWMIDPSSDKFSTFNLTLDGCDNTGVVYNQGVNYSSTKESKSKVFTGGLAGALMGAKGNYAKVKTCKNEGTVLTHDYITDQEGVTPSIRASYCVVAGGLVGYGGYLDMDDVTVKCQIGNGKRQMVAWGGVIGYTIRPFKLRNSTVDVTGYFPRISGYWGNRAVVAVVPVKYNTSAMDLVPDVNGSEIAANNIKCKLMTSASAASAGSTDDLSAGLTNNEFGSDTAIQENLVCGQGFTANDGVTIGDGNTFTAVTAN